MGGSQHAYALIRASVECFDSWGFIRLVSMKRHLGIHLDIHFIVMLTDLGTKRKKEF